MTEISLKERLQPALLDRLIDDARYVTTYRVVIKREELTRLGISLSDIVAILAAQGLRSGDDAETENSTTKASADPVILNLIAAGTALSPAQLKSFTIRPPGAPQGIMLQAFCQIESAIAINAQHEAIEKRMISMRKLRDSVQRDLGWLLNSSSLDTTEDLAPFPHVAKSVVNFGMPSFAGTALHSVDPKATAQRIREVIETFEPRLSKVQVSAEGEDGLRDAMTLSFRIEGELWGQPTSQHVVLQTSIDVETGHAKVGEPASN